MLALLAGTVVGWAADSRPPPVPAIGRPLAERQPLIVGTASDSFPHGYCTSDGTMTGFSYDLLNAIAEVMNLRIERVVLPGRELQARFKAGEFDLVQALSQSPDREAFADFSVPFLAMQGSIFIQKRGSPIRRLEDFNGRKFAIIGAASIVEKFMRDHAITIEPVLVSSSEEALRKVDAGECAGAFLSRLTALSVIDRHDLGNVQVFGRPFDGYDVRHCLAVHKGDHELLARLNEGLTLIHKNGEYDRIYGKWFGRFDAPLITRERVIAYGSLLLGLGLIAALAAYLRQRTLLRRIRGQTEELARQQALLQALHDHVPMGVAVLEVLPGPTHRILTANQQCATLLGVPAADCRAGARLEALPLSSGWRDVLQGLLTRPEPPVPAPEEHSPAGSGRRFAVTRVPLPANPDGLRRTCLLIDEVTARRNLEEEIAQSRKLRAVGELVGGIAHEFNNLLTPILLKADSLRHDLEGHRLAQEDVGLIIQTTQRAAELTRRLLTFGRKTEARIESIHLAAAVDSTFALLRLTVDRRIEWQNAVPPELPPLQLNPTELNQVIVNLILNARDTLLDKLAQKPDRHAWTPRIDITACALPGDHLAGRVAERPALGWQRLTVSDNGLGMPPEVRERIFEPFYTTKDVGKGTGLGLATVWHLVHFAGGLVEVESSPGEGSRFHVYLPVNTANPTPAPSHHPATGTAAGPVRIIVADDDDAVGGAVVAALQKAGHQVHRERDGAEAWRHLSTCAQPYDLVILDINMPGLSGIEVLDRLRGPGKFDGPVLVISGRIGSEEMQRLTASRVTSVLSKPFRLAELQAAVRTCLGRDPR